MNREGVLDAAKNCVCGKRETDYGTPEDNFNRIAGLWSSYLGIDISAIDVSMLMALMKIARIKNGGTDDSFVDLAGYAACGGEIFGKKVDEDSIESTLYSKDGLIGTFKAKGMDEAIPVFNVNKMSELWDQDGDNE